MDNFLMDTLASSLKIMQQIMDISLIEMDDYNLKVSGFLFAIFLFFAVLFGSKILQRVLQRVFSASHRTTPAQVYTLTRIIHYVMIGLAIILTGSALGLNFSKLTLIAGALSVGIGFGLQNVVSNFISGIMILFEKSLKIGDLIELESGVFGEVIEINIRSTLIRTSDNVDILVPNSEFVSGRVTNWTLTDAVRRFRIPFGVAYGSDKNLVRTAALEAAHSVSWTLNDEATNRLPSVWMTGFGDSSLNFVLAVWVSADVVKRPSSMTSDYLWALDDAFRKYKIEIPFPQQDLHIKSSPFIIGSPPKN
ncbi:mechanosensitive ion channel family protein [Cellvibrio sp. OA-2007]|uniref:mechanosensitive ion channel family protein n=1 Tax=Cellvibrio sp. OA-2007 TaxID=529823 RepID=UPI001EE6AC63|nr:mechanosensitive ion channel domain-containing protein [Cellvibrio sp. OA-2007]